VRALPRVEDSHGVPLGDQGVEGVAYVREGGPRGGGEVAADYAQLDVVADEGLALLGKMPPRFSRPLGNGAIPAQPGRVRTPSLAPPHPPVLRESGG
jgi:hypothetical protein